ncbi:MAG: restriction endonuclease subunit S [Candidatus Delongbacteria bacterium]|nr:restriction endonuclease subunit S [Candidatus Delongbacteria bacterium]MBN2833469.1 restriction endonuclease subunit S [Candidatus Delongbacteria bacterium]
MSIEINELPRGWVYTKLGSVLKSEKGKKPKNLSELFDKNYDIPYVDIKAFEKGIICQFTDGYKCNLCSKEDILIVWDGARSGLIGRGIAGAIGSTLAKIYTYFLDKSLVYYFLLSQYKYLNTNTKGVGIPHLDPKILWEIAFPLPPLPEQHRIVAKIEQLFSELDKGIESLKKAQAQLKVYRQSVLKHAFEGKLTEEWRKENQDKLKSADILLEEIKTVRIEKYEEDLLKWKEDCKNATTKGEKKPAKPRKPDELPPLTQDELKELPELPSGWCWGKLGDIADKITDGEHFRPKTVENGVYFLSAKDIQDNHIDFSNPLFITKEDSIKFRKRCNPEKNDILIVSRGATVGRMCVVKTDELFCLLGSVILLKINYLLSSNYFNYSIKSPFLQKKLLGLSGSTAQQAIYLRDLIDINIPFPSLPEQNQIVKEIESRLSVCDNMEKSIEQSLKQAELLRQSILKKAFSGKLVPQDPSDEPAEKLLERIKMEMNLKN